ncbi:hypothetical protein [Sporosarcina sp. P7]|uniref:hypothetical protein n=1 Tax=Sporosarcina sp. P7 TaxID=2048244 RepID=UPI000C16AE17|nr:hypothetical protein [Sporosarcina sp. P7]PID24932.1 hypothetical protein CSV60_06635 [Sporosarcina sp. P7]
MKDKLFSMIVQSEKELMESFDNYSLLINASEIAKKYYQGKPNNTQVDPTGNIPYKYKLGVEQTKIYRGKQLVRVYDTQTKTSATEDYFIRGVSICDALLEDVYELFLMNEDLQITDRRLDSQISFSEDKLPMVLLSYMPNYKKNNGCASVDIEDYFLQYNIYRQLRHAIIHNKGRLKERHLIRIENICREIESRTGKGYIIENIPFIKNNEVNVNMELMCIFRRFQLELTAQLYINLT